MSQKPWSSAKLKIALQNTFKERSMHFENQSQYKICQGGLSSPKEQQFQQGGLRPLSPLGITPSLKGCAEVLLSECEWRCVTVGEASGKALIVKKWPNVLHVIKFGVYSSCGVQNTSLHRKAACRACFRYKIHRKLKNWLH